MATWCSMYVSKQPWCILWRQRENIIKTCKQTTWHRFINKCNEPSILSAYKYYSFESCDTPAPGRTHGARGGGRRRAGLANGGRRQRVESVPAGRRGSNQCLQATPSNCAMPRVTSSTHTLGCQPAAPRTREAQHTRTPQPRSKHNRYDAVFAFVHA